MTIRVFELAEDRQRRMLSHALEVADDLGLRREDLVLVGGAVLQAHWRHRRAEGIWLVIEDEDWWRGWDGAGTKVKNQQHLKILEDTEGSQPITDFGDLSLRWSTREGPVGIYSEPPRGPLPLRETLRESSTGTLAETPRSILKRNSRTKMRSLNQFHLRDAADILAAARMDPEALSSAYGWSGQGIDETPLREIRWQIPLVPDEGERRIQLAALSCLQAEAEKLPVPTHPDLRIDSIPWMPYRHAEPFKMRILPEERFCHPRLLENQPLTQKAAGTPMQKNMAGHPLSPSPEEIQEWLRTKDPRDLPSGALGFMEEYLKQVTGREFASFRQGCGASMADIARITRWCSSLMAPSTRVMVNHYAHVLAGDPFEIVDTNTWLHMDS